MVQQHITQTYLFDTLAFEVHQADADVVAKVFPLVAYYLHHFQTRAMSPEQCPAISNPLIRSKHFFSKSGLMIAITALVRAAAK